MARPNPMIDADRAASQRRRFEENGAEYEVEFGTDRFQYGLSDARAGACARTDDACGIEG